MGNNTLLLKLINEPIIRDSDTFIKNSALFTELPFCKELRNVKQDSLVAELTRLMFLQLPQEQESNEEEVWFNGVLSPEKQESLDRFIHHTSTGNLREYTPFLYFDEVYDSQEVNYEPELIIEEAGVDRRYCNNEFCQACCGIQTYFHPRLLKYESTQTKIIRLANTVMMATESYNVLCISQMESIFQKNLLEFRKRVLSNPSIKQVLKLNDFNIINMYMSLPASKRDYKCRYLLGRVYLLRNILNDHFDYGLKRKLIRDQAYMSQGVSHWLLNLIKASTNDVTSNVNSAKEYVQHMLADLWSRFSARISFISEEAINFVRKAFSKFFNWVFSAIIMPQIFGENAMSVEQMKMLKMLGFFSCWAFLSSVGLITYGVSKAVYASIISGGTFVANQLFAQAPMDVYSVYESICKNVIGLNEKCWQKLKEVIKTTTSLMSGGTIIANSIKTILFLLPGTLRMALLYKFGSKESILESDIEKWRAISNSMVAISKIQTVVTSPEYESRLETHIKEGTTLVRKCDAGLKASVKQMFMNSYIKLYTIHVNLMTKRYSTGDRQIPFCFHVSGPPGIGKTTSIKDLLTRACDFEKRDFYSKDNADVFWSGYAGHPVIVMDEFLLGKPDDNYDTAQSFLTMVSSGEWRPNFASVDDPNVGIKGNSCKPKVIATLNNTDHDMIDHKINEAFQRRRKFVIRCKRTDQYYSEASDPSNLDYRRYTDEELEQRVWMNFDILPGTFSISNVNLASNLTYNELVHFIREQYEHHVETQKRVNGILNESVVSDKTPSEIMDEVFRNVYDIPCKPVSVLEAFSSCFSLFAQGSFSSSNYANLVMSQIHRGEEPVILKMDIEEEEGILSRLSGLLNNKCVLVASLFAIISLARSYITGEDQVDETFHAQSEKPNKTTQKAKSKSHFRRASEFKAQGPEVSVLDLCIDGKVKKAIPIGGKWLLTYYHGYDFYPGFEGEWSLSQLGRNLSLKFDSERVMICDELDICLVYFDHPQFQQCKNIVKNFISESEVDKLNNVQIVLDSGERSYLSTAQIEESFSYYEPITQRSVFQKKGLRYRAPTKLGDCGIPVKIVSGNLVGKIAGIHVAGSDCRYDPIGMSNLITREVLQEVMMAAQGPQIDFETLNLSNLVDIQTITPNEAVNLPTKTKLEPSAISNYFIREAEKEPAIMSKEDPRANGMDPIDVSLKKLLEKQDCNLDPVILERVENELFEKLDKNLKMNGIQRELTFVEACEGIPCLMNSLNMKTSPGFPLVHLNNGKPGKSNFVWFDEGELKYTEVFKEMVEKKVEEIKTYQIGGRIDHRFIMFLKDELRKLTKIEKCETRAIFCNNLVSLVAFRMLYGGVFIALMNNFDVTGFAVGLNQYSNDMDVIAKHLQKINPSLDKLVAGDYSDYDQRFVKQAEQVAYNIFARLCISKLGRTKEEMEYLRVHETESPFQILLLLILVKCSNKSGCWLTTLINDLVNNVYFRYIFIEKYESKSFDEECVLVVQGDDHILAESENIDFTPLEVKGLMEKIGQKYTSAFKERELLDKCDRFADITFLGAIPRIGLNGKWTGALRKETLEQTPLWTRDSNGSLDMTIQQMIDYASQWDKSYFDSYVTELRQAYLLSGRYFEFQDTYSALHYVVCGRTAASGQDFQRYFLTAQGPVELGNNDVRYIDQSLTQIATAEEAEQAPEEGNFSKGIINKCMNAEQPDYDTMPKAFVLRGTYTWSSTQVADTQVAQIDVPFDLFSSGALGSVQDNGFYQFLYSQPEIEIKIMVVGTPVQQGALICFFQPLYTATFAVAAGYSDYTTFNHIMLTPNNNTSVSLKIPFRYWKTFLNNKSGFTSPNNASLGKIIFRVWSQLTTQSLPTTASIALYSSINSIFRVPRPRTATGQGPLKAQGANYSTVNSVNKYNVGTMTGNMPSETNIGTTQTARGELSVPTVPLDNPPMSGCSIPVHAILPSMSKGVGIEPTVSLQFHHGMLHREPDSLRDVEETRIEHLCSRKGYLTSFVVSTTDTIGSELLNIPLNSLLRNPSVGVSTDVPANMAVLNQFNRWRADIELEIFVAKTVFHSVRLLCVAGYGETGSLAGLNYGSYPNRIAEFTGENQWVSTRVPFNSPTEFLRTYEGGVTRTVDDYSMGTFSVIVLSPLKASSTVVSSSCSCYVFVRFRNVRVFEPRTGLFTSIQDGDQLYTLYGQGPRLIAQMDATEAIRSPETNNISSDVSSRTTVIDRYSGDENEPVVVSVTKDSDLPDSERPCSLKVGDKYEYCIRDITEIGRRHMLLNIQKLDGFSGTTYYGPQGFMNDYSAIGNWSNYASCSFFVYPYHPVSRLYAGWSGHLKYRFVFTGIAANVNGNVLTNFKVSYVPSRFAKVTQTVPVYAGTVPPAAGTVNSTMFDQISIFAGETQVGKTLTGSTALWNANTYIQKPELAVSSAPLEYTISQGSNMVYIDVSVPFMNNNNYLPTVPNLYAAQKLDAYNGRLLIQLPRNFGDNTTNMEVFQAYGDDFRLHAYSPIYHHYTGGYNTSGTITVPSGGIQVGQNVYGDA